MKRSQKKLVPYFRPYHIDEDNPELPEPKSQEPNSRTLANFNPDTDIIDRKILYEITGRKKDPDEKFSDESSEEEGYESMHEGG